MTTLASTYISEMLLEVSSSGAETCHIHIVKKQIEMD